MAFKPTCTFIVARMNIQSRKPSFSTAISEPALSPPRLLFHSSLSTYTIVSACASRRSVAKPSRKSFAIYTQSLIAVVTGQRCQMRLKFTCQSYARLTSKFNAYLVVIRQIGGCLTHARLVDMKYVYSYSLTYYTLILYSFRANQTYISEE